MTTRSLIRSDGHPRTAKPLTNGRPLYAAADLKHCNDLTRLSPLPGFLDYETYARYLVLIGHVKHPPTVEAAITSEPLNSILELVEGPYELAQRKSNATSWRADQALWSEKDLPEILYALDTPARWLALKDLKEPPWKSYKVNGTHLRDIPVLPDQVSPNLEGWRYVAWTRMDPRIGLKDILDRVPSCPVGDLTSQNAFRGQNSTMQMRTARFRDDFPALGWVKKGSNFEKDRRKLEAKLKAAGIDPERNTTRGVSWGLIEPSKGESGGRILVPVTKSWPSSVELCPKLFPALPTSLTGKIEEFLSITVKSSVYSPSNTRSMMAAQPWLDENLYGQFITNGWGERYLHLDNSVWSDMAAALKPAGSCLARVTPWTRPTREKPARSPSNSRVLAAARARPVYPELTLEASHTISLSGTSADLSKSNNYMYSNDDIFVTPSKRPRFGKLKPDDSSLERSYPYGPTFEQPLTASPSSRAEPYQALYARSFELRDRFGESSKKKNRRDIPDDILTPSFPDRPRTDSHAYGPRASQDSLPYKLKRLRAEHVRRTQSTIQLQGTEKVMFNPLKIKYGSTVLTLKTKEQRANISTEDQKLLKTFHPAGTKERNRQLEYVLDPIRARFGFQDCNGYEAPLPGGNDWGTVGCNIWYLVTHQEAAEMA